MYTILNQSASTNSKTQVSLTCVTSRQKAFLFGLIGAAYEPHELAHGVAVVVRWPEGVLCDCPSWRENHKVRHSCTCDARLERVLVQGSRCWCRHWPAVVLISKLPTYTSMHDSCCSVQRQECRIAGQISMCNAATQKCSAMLKCHVQAASHARQFCVCRM